MLRGATGAVPTILLKTLQFIVILASCLSKTLQPMSTKFMSTFSSAVYHLVHPVLNYHNLVSHFRYTYMIIGSSAVRSHLAYVRNSVIYPRFIGRARAFNYLFFIKKNNVQEVRCVWKDQLVNGRSHQYKIC